MSVVGAGSVGTAIAYACLIRGSADALALYDTNSAKVRAEVLDLNHGTQFTPSREVMTSRSPRDPTWSSSPRAQNSIPASRGSNLPR